MNPKALELQKLAKEYSVLYVEDDKDIQQRMLKYLQKFFSRVDVADDGKIGLELYKNNSYDIVITDLSMPQMNGIEMLQEIRKIDDEQLVLITSAHTKTSYMIEAIKAGVDGYIIKPFVLEQLNYELYKILKRLQKFSESAMYKKNLENMIDKKSAIVSSLMHFQSANYEKTLYSMVAMIEDRDTYTAGHSKRVARYAKMIAQKMGYSDEDCAKIYQAGMLHDIGKMATPDTVLLNPKHLNSVEYKLIQEHVNVGFKLLNNVPMFEKLAEIVHSHHEQYDGSGYPRGIKEDEITPLARIMIIADAFDAMTTTRIYKGRKSVTEALDEIEKLSGKQFHPEEVKQALITLKDVVIDDRINQIPKTAIEEKRFAYFYKDALCDVYNKSYLELLLAQNRFEKRYKSIEIININKFSAYNKQHTWEKGDVFLKEFAKILKNYFSNDLIFRVMGDDFVVLCEELQSTQNLPEVLQDLLLKTELSYTHKTINLMTTNIHDLEEIEKYNGK